VVGMELFMGEMALIYHCRMPKIVSEESDKILQLSRYFVS
jgi:hypothetical protein